MVTKLGQTIHDHKILIEFDYGCNRIRKTAVICPWIRKIAIFDFIYTLASTINQSAPNLVKWYRVIRSRVTLIMGAIGPEQLELLAFEFEKLLYFTLFTLASTNISQLVPKLVKIYMTLRSHISLIKGVIGPEQVDLFALELESLFK